MRGLLEAHGFEAMVSPDSVWAIVPSSSTGRRRHRAWPCRRRSPTRRAGWSRAAAICRRRAATSRARAKASPRSRRASAIASSIATLLEHALTHRSRAHEDVTGGVVDNESLEFLGDAVVGLVIAEALYREYPDLDEGAKSKIQRVAGLGRPARPPRRGARPRRAPAPRARRGEDGRAAQDRAPRRRVRGDRRGDLSRRRPRRRRRSSCGGSCGCRSRRRAAAPPRSSAASTTSRRCRSALQARGLGLPEYRVAAERGPEHDKMFEVEVRVNGDVAATATGRSKKDAEQQAAQRALQAFA